MFQRPTKYLFDQESFLTNFMIKANNSNVSAQKNFFAKLQKNSRQPLKTVSSCHLLTGAPNSDKSAFIQSLKPQIENLHHTPVIIFDDFKNFDFETSVDQINQTVIDCLKSDWTKWIDKLNPETVGKVAQFLTKTFAKTLMKTGADAGKVLYENNDLIRMLVANSFDEHERKVLQNIFQKNKQPLHIFFDNIDQLDKKQLQSLLNEIQFLQQIPNLNFYLTFNENTPHLNTILNTFSSPIYQLKVAKSLNIAPHL